MKTLPFLIATDLDGTLLDHDTYDFSPALPALKALRDREIPVVIVTSKTESEVLELRTSLGNNSSFIVENGGALVDSDGDETCRLVLGKPREEILQFVRSARQKHGFSFHGYGDMDPKEIAKITGLTLNEARQSADRQASEPLVWQDSETAKQDFAKLAHEAGFALLQGGRFLHVGGRTNKGYALKRLIERYGARGVLFETIIALGDSGNDIALLEAADIPIWVRKHHGPTPETPFWKGSRCTVAKGPTGWHNEVMHILEAVK